MSRANRSRRAVGVAVVIGIVLVVVGLAMMLGQPEFTVGWFAYAPLSEAAFLPTTLLLGPLGLAGLASVVTGTALTAFAAGWILARRRRSNDPDRPPVP